MSISTHKTGYKTIESAYPDLKPATTLRELFEQFEKVIRLPESVVDEPVSFSRSTGEPTKFRDKKQYATQLNLAKTRDINDEDWSTRSALKATNKVFDWILSNPPFFVMDGKYYSIDYSETDGYRTCYISRIRPQVVK